MRSPRVLDGEHGSMSILRIQYVLYSSSSSVAQQAFGLVILLWFLALNLVDFNHCIVGYDEHCSKRDMYA